MVVYLYSSMAVTCWSRLEVIPPRSREEYLPKKFYTSDRILVRSGVGRVAKSVHRSIAIELHATTRSLAHYQPISASMVHKHRPVKMAPILMTPGNCFESDGSDANVATTARTATVIWWNPTFFLRCPENTSCYPQGFNHFTNSSPHQCVFLMLHVAMSQVAQHEKKYVSYHVFRYLSQFSRSTHTYALPWDLLSHSLIHSVTQSGIFSSSKTTATTDDGVGI